MPQSSSVRSVLSEAKRLADAYRHAEWNDEHVLLALLRREPSLLRRTGVDVEALTRSLSQSLESAESLAGSHALLPSRRPAPRVDDLMRRAAARASLGGFESVELPHVLLGMLERGSSVSRALLKAGADVMKAEELMRGWDEDSADPVPPIPGIGLFGYDLVELALRGRLDPVVGREREIARVLQVLNRRTKNNPILIGEPGVGKTAIVEGIAQRIAKGSVPQRFRNTRIVSLNVAALLANSGNRGEFEGRLHSLLEALAAARGSVVLFVDEAHLLIGAGASEGGLDAASILKPALARGDFAFIGATTAEAYRRFIEPDAALERRLSPVWVREPSSLETKEILRRLRPLLESHHACEIADSAVDAAVDLSVRYLPGRRLPDKAIDLLDEAASRMSLGERGTGTETSVTDLAVAAVVEDMTGIPVPSLLEAESERLLGLEARLRRRVFGQDAAVHVVAQAILRGRLGLVDGSRPIGAFLFTGPPAVGKTALAEALASELFGDPRALLRVDMSEFTEPHSVARLVGAPPGYVGYNDASSLTEAVRRRPYQVVLFESVDRAHEDPLYLVQQILDSGRLTDGKGRIVDFRHSLIIATVADPGEVRRVAHALGHGIDEVVEFVPLTDSAKRAVVMAQLERVRAALSQLGLALHVTPGALSHLMRVAFDTSGGGRQLRRLIDEEVVSRVVRAVLAAPSARGGRVTVFRRGDRLGARVEGGSSNQTRSSNESEPESVYDHPSPEPEEPEAPAVSATLDDEQFVLI